MKKLPLLFSLYSSLLVLSVAYGYTQSDIDNASFLADQGIIVKHSQASAYRLDDTVTRAEVVGIALLVKGISLPSNYQCKGYFSDVVNNDWICRAVEIAADNGMVTRANTKFRPQDKITRAEGLGIIMKATDLSIRNENGNGRLTIDSNVPWQQDIFISAYNKGLVDTASVFDGSGGKVLMKFNPNQAATRGMIFDITEKSIPYIYLTSPETTTLESACVNFTESGIKDINYGSGKTPILYPLIRKDATSSSYMLHNNIITYVAERMSRYGEIILSSEIYQFNCVSNTHTQITKSLISGLHTGVRLDDADNNYILARILQGEFDLPGMRVFFIYSQATQTGREIRSDEFSGLEKYRQFPTNRYLTSVEAMRIRNGQIEAKIEINDAGPNSDPTSLPEYTLISEQWVPFDPQSNSLQ